MEIEGTEAEIGQTLEGAVEVSMGEPELAADEQMLEEDGEELYASGHQDGYY